MVTRAKPALQSNNQQRFKNGQWSRDNWSENSNKNYTGGAAVIKNFYVDNNGILKKRTGTTIVGNFYDPIFDTASDIDVDTLNRSMTIYAGRYDGIVGGVLSQYYLSLRPINKAPFDNLTIYAGDIIDKKYPFDFNQPYTFTPPAARKIYGSDQKIIDSTKNITDYQFGASKYFLHENLETLACFGRVSGDFTYQFGLGLGPYSIIPTGLELNFDTPPPVRMIGNVDKAVVVPAIPLTTNGTDANSLKYWINETANGQRDINTPEKRYLVAANLAQAKQYWDTFMGHKLQVKVTAEAQVGTSYDPDVTQLKEIYMTGVVCSGLENATAQTIPGIPATAAVIKILRVSNYLFIMTAAAGVFRWNSDQPTNKAVKLNEVPLTGYAMIENTNFIVFAVDGGVWAIAKSSPTDIASKISLSVAAPGNVFRPVQAILLDGLQTMVFVTITDSTSGEAHWFEWSGAVITDAMIFKPNIVLPINPNGTTIGVSNILIANIPSVVTPLAYFFGIFNGAATTGVGGFYAYTISNNFPIKLTATVDVVLVDYNSATNSVYGFTAVDSPAATRGIYKYSIASNATTHPLTANISNQRSIDINGATNVFYYDNTASALRRIVGDTITTVTGINSRLNFVKLVQGQIWLGSVTQGLWRWINDTDGYRLPGVPATASIVDFVSSNNNVYYTSTAANGVYRFIGGPETYGQISLLNNLGNLVIDNRGNLIAGNATATLIYGLYFGLDKKIYFEITTDDPTRDNTRTANWWQQLTKVGQQGGRVDGIRYNKTPLPFVGQYGFVAIAGNDGDLVRGPYSPNVYANLVIRSVKSFDEIFANGISQAGDAIVLFSNAGNDGNYYQQFYINIDINTLKIFNQLPFTGNPTAMVQKDNRLFFGGFAGNQNQIVASAIGNLRDFSEGVRSPKNANLVLPPAVGVFTQSLNFFIEDNPGAVAALISRALSGDGVVWIVTERGTYFLKNNAGQDVVPYSLGKQNDIRGSAEVDPIIFDSRVFVLSDDKNNLFLMDYNFQKSIIEPINVSAIVNDLFELDIATMDGQRDPYYGLWFQVAGNRFFGLSYNNNADVIAWHEHDSPGAIDQPVGGPPVPLEEAVIVDQMIVADEKFWITFRGQYNAAVKPQFLLEVQNPEFVINDPDNQHLWYPALDACRLITNGFLDVTGDNPRISYVHLFEGAKFNTDVVVPVTAGEVYVTTIFINGLVFKKLFFDTDSVSTRTVASGTALLQCKWLTTEMVAAIKASGPVKRFIVAEVKLEKSAISQPLGTIYDYRVDDHGLPFTKQSKELLVLDGKVLAGNGPTPIYTTAANNYFDNGVFVVVGFAFDARVESLPVGQSISSDAIVQDQQIKQIRSGNLLITAAQGVTLSAKTADDTEYSKVRHESFMAELVKQGARANVYNGVAIPPLPGAVMSPMLLRQNWQESVPSPSGRVGPRLAMVAEPGYQMVIENMTINFNQVKRG